MIRQFDYIDFVSIHIKIQAKKAKNARDKRLLQRGFLSLWDKQAVKIIKNNLPCFQLMTEDPIF